MPDMLTTVQTFLVSLKNFTSLLNAKSLLRSNGTITVIDECSKDRSYMIAHCARRFIICSTTCLTLHIF